MNNKPIGVFDSGIGGLTVLKKIIKVLPNEKYIYYADTDNVPYGTKPKEDVKKYVKEAVEFLIKNNVKVIVIACNTATSIAIKDLRNEYSLPIIGIEPAVKPAIENRCNKKVLVMATPITIREEKLHNLVNGLNAESNVDLIAMPKLVEFAEAGEFDSNKVTEYLISQLKDFDLEKYSELVLGCTHFPFFKEEIRNVISRYTYSKEFISGNGNLVLFFDGDMKDNAIQIKDVLANTLSLIVNVDYYAITNEYIINIPINK